MCISDRVMHEYVYTHYGLTKLDDYIRTYMFFFYCKCRIGERTDRQTDERRTTIHLLERSSLARAENEILSLHCSNFCSSLLGFLFVHTTKCKSPQIVASRLCWPADRRSATTCSRSMPAEWMMASKIGALKFFSSSVIFNFVAVFCAPLLSCAFTLLYSISSQI